MMCDVGVFQGRPAIIAAQAIREGLSGRAPSWLDGGFRLIFQAWRVVTPGMVLASLFLYFGLIVPPRATRPGRRSSRPGWRSGLFYGYFYYWTAAGMALLLAWIVDSGHRRVAFHVGWIGGLVGLPYVVSSAIFKGTQSKEAFERIDAFLHIPRFHGLFCSRFEILTMVLLLVWIWFKRRDLLPIGLMILTGWLLLNHQAVSRLQIQNFHYRLVVQGPVTGVAMILVLATLRPSGRWTRPAWIASGAAIGLLIASGVWLRYLETDCKSSREEMSDYRHYSRRCPPGRSTGPRGRSRPATSWRATRPSPIGP